MDESLKVLESDFQNLLDERTAAAEDGLDLIIENEETLAENSNDTMPTFELPPRQMDEMNNNVKGLGSSGVNDDGEVLKRDNLLSTSNVVIELTNDDEEKREVEEDDDTSTDEDGENNDGENNSYLSNVNHRSSHGGDGGSMSRPSPAMSPLTSPMKPPPSPSLAPLKKEGMPTKKEQFLAKMRGETLADIYDNKELHFVEGWFFFSFFFFPDEPQDLKKEKSLCA
jgi:hypothetical protein